MIKPNYLNTNNNNNLLKEDNENIINMEEIEKDINSSNDNEKNNQQNEANRLILKFNFLNINEIPNYSNQNNLSQSNFLSKNNSLNKSLNKINSDNSLCNTLFKSNEPFNNKDKHLPHIKVSSPIINNPNYFRYINQNSNRNKLKCSTPKSDNVLASSTKHSVNAIINLIHNNYNDIVEYDTLNSNKQQNNNYIDKTPSNKDNYIESSGFNNNKSIHMNHYPKQTYKFINYNSTNLNLSNTTCSTFSNSKITAKQLFKLNDLSMYNLLYLLYNEYNTFIKYSTPLKEKITTSLINLFLPVISSFKYQYDNILLLTDYSFQYSQFKKGKYIYPLFDLIIKAKIQNTKDNFCYSFSYDFMIEHEKETEYKHYTETIKFDSAFHNNNSSFWLMSEIEEYKGTVRRTCYTQQIFPYNNDDIIVFRINVFNVNGKLIPQSIKFNPMEIENKLNQKNIRLSYIEYEKGFNKAIKTREVFDSLRHCDIENMVHIWKNIKTLTNVTVIEHIQSIFGVCFEIENIWYDIVKYYVYKFKLKASKVGVVCKNRYINYDLEVVNDDDYITNEAVCLGVLNVKASLQKIMIRKGNICVVYITSLY